MNNQIKYVEIKNFKTLKHVKFDCKKINLFIGKPNVGKSNLLEALSLLGAPYSVHNTTNNILSEFIRYKKLEDLFYDKEIGNQVEVNTNIGVAALRYHFNIDSYDLILGGDETISKELKPKRGEKLSVLNERFNSYFLEEKKRPNPIRPEYFLLSSLGKVINNPSMDHLSPVKKYDFKKLKEYPNRFHMFLAPPYGDNLYTVIQRNKKLLKEIHNLFKEYKLRFFLDSDKTHLYLQKLVSGVGIGFDYYGVADTLQRYIFYMMAIETNKDSVLLFEEPEAHSFPPYIREMALRIADSKTNQFFITTHSPFILNTLLENVSVNDVAVFQVEYEKFQTKIRILSEKEISDMLNYGNDIFFSLK